MRVLFLNQYFPPDAAPTGVLLREVGDALLQAGHEVDFVAARESYRETQQKAHRWWREFRALRRMLADGLRRPRADVVFSASSPPCLLLAARAIAARHRAKSVHWAMDLYPDIAVALREIPTGHFAGAIERMMGACYRRTDCVIALDEDMAAQLRRHDITPEIVRPWVFASVLKQLAATEAAPGGAWTWIYSGNLGRAHEWETLLAAQALLESRGAGIRLRFQGGGPSWEAAQRRAAELKLQHCEWRGYVEEAELPRSLLECHALAITQRPAAQGLLWPSKLGLAMSLPRPLVWVGPKDGAIVRLLRPFSQAGIFAPGEAGLLADWLLAQKSRNGSQRCASGFDPRAHREASLRAVERIVGTFQDNGKHRAS